LQYKSLRFSRFLSDYGMLGVLLLLCGLFSVLTLHEQHPNGTVAAGRILKRLSAQAGWQDGVLIVARGGSEDIRFTADLRSRLQARGFTAVHVVTGDPSAIRGEFSRLAAAGDSVRWITVLQAYSRVIADIKADFPFFEAAQILTPESYRYPTFLLADNLRNVANQITVIAVIAVGMTLVIISAGIDLSVGSLIALSAVVTAWLIGVLGGDAAGTGGLVLSSAVGVLLCGAVGAFSGWMITAFRIPPFIATLAMMQVAAGCAYIISQGKPIYRIPESFTVLGRGSEPILGIPYAVLLMILLYIAAHFFMSRTALGRYIYAVGGNEEAARLAGIRVRAVLLFVYVISGALAGLGGIIMASQLKSGAPTYGLTYELYVIAAVVVGGASLSGGEGRIFGTLIGALIIGVIQNGMNLTNVESYTQKVVLGLVILAAVLLDRIKQRRVNRSAV
jgi:ribose transport system permease protein